METRPSSGVSNNEVMSKLRIDFDADDSDVKWLNWLTTILLDDNCCDEHENAKEDDKKKNLLFGRNLSTGVA